MKTLIILFVTVVTISSFSSCKKNKLKAYTCDCEIIQRDNGTIVNQTQSTYKTSEIEEADAKEECELNVYQYAGNLEEGIEQTVTCSVR
jgi:hypothetical protein